MFSFEGRSFSCSIKSMRIRNPAPHLSLHQYGTGIAVPYLWQVR